MPEPARPCAGCTASARNAEHKKPHRLLKTGWGNRSRNLLPHPVYVLGTLQTLRS